MIYGLITVLASCWSLTASVCILWYFFSIFMALVLLQLQLDLLLVKLKPTLARTETHMAAGRHSSTHSHKRTDWEIKWRIALLVNWAVSLFLQPGNDSMQFTPYRKIILIFTNVLRKRTKKNKAVHYEVWGEHRCPPSHIHDISLSRMKISTCTTVEMNKNPKCFLLERQYHCFVEKQPWKLDNVPFFSTVAAWMFSFDKWIPLKGKFRPWWERNSVAKCVHFMCHLCLYRLLIHTSLTVIPWVEWKLLQDTNIISPSFSKIKFVPLI